jgi:CRP-like cAMP-binding protein
MASIFQDLSEADLDKVHRLVSDVDVAPEEIIFHEGDSADCLYYIDSGTVSLYIERFNSTQEIQEAKAGDWFGEVAVVNQGYRTASAKAKEATRLRKVSSVDFHAFLEQEPEIDAAVHAVVNARNERLVLEEKMLNVAGYCDRDMHISIKGDASLRESAMVRARYESVVDQHLEALTTCFEDLLVNRTAHRIMIGFNNGEIRISTVLDPFSEEFHPALRLLDTSYVERHFPQIDYKRKSEMIRRMYQTIGEDAFFKELPEHLNHGFSNYFNHWQPLPVHEIPKIVSQLPLLRKISNFYARSATINIVKDAIQMQFNCDGSHIVSARAYERFVKENL